MVVGSSVIRRRFGFFVGPFVPNPGQGGSGRTGKELCAVKATRYRSRPVPPGVLPGGRVRAAGWEERKLIPRNLGVDPFSCSPKGVSHVQGPVYFIVSS